MKKILVIDDNEDILDLIYRILTKNGYLVDKKKQIDINNLLILKNYDLILLDVMLGTEYTGFDICSIIRNSVKIPIIFLTAKTSENDLLEGFNVGGDDYIKKPFSPNELLARVDAHLRRDDRMHECREKISFDNITIYSDEKSVYYMDDKICFTKKEFEIIYLLASNHNKIFSQEEIYDKIYDIESYALFRGISEFIYKIRMKFKAYGVNPIMTIRGIGYKWKK